jgi:hypothetical protein
VMELVITKAIRASIARVKASASIKPMLKKLAMMARTIVALR